MKSRTQKCLVERYCSGDTTKLDALLAGERKIILDIGCGAALSAPLLFGEHLKRHDYLGVDISSAVDVARTRFAEAGYPGDFLRATLTDLSVPDGSIDIIFSEGVLHHTDSTRESLTYFSHKLKRGGMLLSMSTQKRHSSENSRTTTCAKPLETCLTKKLGMR